MIIINIMKCMIVVELLALAISILTLIIMMIYNERGEENDTHTKRS